MFSEMLHTSSAVTIAITFTPSSHTICQKSWHVVGKGPCVAMYCHSSPPTWTWKRWWKKKTATKLNLCVSTLPYTSTFPDKSTPYPYCQVFGSNLAGRNNSVTHPCNSTLMIAFWGIVRRYLSFWKVHSIFANMEKLENLLKSVRILLFQRFKISVLGAEKGKRGIGEGGRRLGDGVHTKN